MAYADKRDGKPTGSFVGEWPQGRKKRRFKTLKDAKDYETFVKLMGREPPQVLDGLESTGQPTFAEVTEKAKAAGGPKGKWKAERDVSLCQRLAYCVQIIGAYEVHNITRSILKKISDSLAKRPGKFGEPMTNATINRYLAAAAGVLEYAAREELIPAKPSVPWLTEDKKARDILMPGQDATVLSLMREQGAHLEALVVEVLMATGLRAGELAKLGPDQITEVEHEGGTYGCIGLRKDQTKNNTARSVIFPADLAKQIKAVIAAGNLPKRDRVLNVFKAACKRAGYDGNLVLHSLRHTRNERMRKAGVKKEVRMKSLGHKSERANSIYEHLDLEDQLNAAKIMENSAGISQNPASQVIDFARAASRK